MLRLARGLHRYAVEADVHGDGTILTARQLSYVTMRCAARRYSTFAIDVVSKNARRVAEVFNASKQQRGTAKVTRQYRQPGNGVAVKQRARQSEEPDNSRLLEGSFVYFYTVPTKLNGVMSRCSVNVRTPRKVTGNKEQR